MRICFILWIDSKSVMASTMTMMLTFICTECDIKMKCVSEEYKIRSKIRFLVWTVDSFPSKCDVKNGTTAIHPMETGDNGCTCSRTQHLFAFLHDKTKIHFSGDFIAFRLIEICYEYASRLNINNILIALIRNWISA